MARIIVPTVRVIAAPRPVPIMLRCQPHIVTQYETLGPVTVQGVILAVPLWVRRAVPALIALLESDNSDSPGKRSA